MAASAAVIVHNFPISLHSPRYNGIHKTQTPALYDSRFLPSNSFLNLNKQFFLPVIHTKNKLRNRRNQPVFAAQSKIFKVLQTVFKVGKDGIEAGTGLVPDSIPRPIARIAVTVVAVTVALFLLKSFLSTAFFVLAMMGLIYSAFIALNKDEAPKVGDGTTSTEDSLEEARRIMEKYK